MILLSADHRNNVLGYWGSEKEMRHLVLSYRTRGLYRDFLSMLTYEFQQNHLPLVSFPVSFCIPVFQDADLNTSYASFKNLLTWHKSV